jgi:hypothetical protein
MKCRVCSANTQVAFSALVLNKYDVPYYRCLSCGFVQSQEPFWLSEAYASPINLSDTGLVLRNQRSARITLSIIFLFFQHKHKYLDFAGGIGLFTRLMRDFGVDFDWHDPYTENVLARGFVMNSDSKYELATTFESYEHFVDPIAETKVILQSANNILATTELIPHPIPPVDSWWYYGFEHGQHIAFYSKNSISKIAQVFNLQYYNADNFHLLTKSKLPWWGRQLFKSGLAKYVLYALSFPISLFVKSKTMTDLQMLKKVSQ